MNEQETVPPQLPPGVHPDMIQEEMQQAFTGFDAEKAAKEYSAQQINHWHAEWKAYKFKIGQNANLAMAPYVNHERKAVEQKL